MIKKCYLARKLNHIMFLFSKNQRYTLAELFKINQGIAFLSKKKIETQVGEYIYKTIYVSDLAIKYNRIHFEGLTDFATLTSIKKDKLLTKEDYIITCKGEIKGFALYNSDDIFENLNELNYSGLLVSNHFIVLRPRSSTLEIFNNSYLLYNILDLLVPKINAFVKQLESRKKIPYVTISEVENFSIILPGSNFMEIVENFEAYYTAYKEKLNLLIQAEEELKRFNASLLNEIEVQCPSL